MLWRLPRGFLDAESCQIDISHSVDHQQQRIMRQIVQRIHGGTDGGDITTVLRHAAHHAPDGVAGIGIGDADMPIKIPDRTVKIGDRPLKTGFFAWPMPLPCYECRFPSRRTSKIHRVRIWKRTSLRIMKPCVPLSASPRRWPEFLQAGATPQSRTLHSAQRPALQHSFRYDESPLQKKRGTRSVWNHLPRQVVRHMARHSCHHLPRLCERRRFLSFLLSSLPYSPL